METTSSVRIEDGTDGPTISVVSNDPTKSADDNATAAANAYITASKLLAAYEEENDK